MTVPVSTTRPAVVLPTYNERENLPRLVAALRGLQRGLRMVVVDDDSPDGTGALADDLAAQGSDLTVLHRRGQRGFGGAQTAGLAEALRGGADAVVTMDCDFSHDPAAVPALLDALAENDLVIGSRYVAGGEIRDWPLFRLILSATANSFVRLLFRLPAHDCTSGFRAYRPHVLATIPWERLHSPGYSFLVEVLYWATRTPGARTAEVPICFTERRQGRSKMGWREIVLGAANLLKLRLQLAVGSPPDPRAEANKT